MVALALRLGFAGMKSIMLCGLICVGDSTIGDMEAFDCASVGGSTFTGGGTSGAVADRSWDFAGAVSKPSLAASLLLLDFVERVDVADNWEVCELDEGREVVESGEKGLKMVCERAGDLTDGELLPFFTASFRSPVELACDRGRRVLDRSDMVGRLGVGVAGSSSSLGKGLGGAGWLPSERECTRFTDESFLDESPDEPVCGPGAGALVRVASCDWP